MASKNQAKKSIHVFHMKSKAISIKNLEKRGGNKQKSNLMTKGELSS